LSKVFVACEHIAFAHDVTQILTGLRRYWSEPGSNQRRNEDQAAEPRTPPGHKSDQQNTEGGERNEGYKYMDN
jgi:hypothetical protein